MEAPSVGLILSPTVVSATLLKGPHVLWPYHRQGGHIIFLLGRNTPRPYPRQCAGMSIQHCVRTNSDEEQCTYYKYGFESVTSRVSIAAESS